MSVLKRSSSEELWHARKKCLIQLVGPLQKLSLDKKYVRENPTAPVNAVTMEDRESCFDPDDELDVDMRPAGANYWRDKYHLVIETLSDSEVETEEANINNTGSCDASSGGEGISNEEESMEKQLFSEVGEQGTSFQTPYPGQRIEFKPTLQVDARFIKNPFALQQEQQPLPPLLREISLSSGKELVLYSPQSSLPLLTGVTTKEPEDSARKASTHDIIFPELQNFDQDVMLEDSS